MCYKDTASARGFAARLHEDEIGVLRLFFGRRTLFYASFFLAPKFLGLFMNTLPLWHEIRGLQALSLCDWAGHLSLILFCGGCNLRCPTCHNALLAWQPEACPPVPRESVAKLLHKHRGWYEGIVLSGGEATTHPHLEALLDDIHLLSQEATGEALPVRLDSNGMRPALLERLLRDQRIAAAAVDVKGCYEQYPALSGGCVEADQAQEALEHCYALAEEFPGKIHFRTTQVPGLEEQHLDKVRAYLPPNHVLTVQNYVPPRT